MIYQVRNEARTTDRLDGLLSGLRLLLAIDDRHVRYVNLQEVVLAGTTAQLCHSLNERHALNVTNGATKFNYAHIWFLATVINRDPSYLLYPVLNGIGYVRHDLYRLAQIISFALAFDDVLIDLARGNVILSSQGDVQVAFVVAEIEIDFAAVGQDEYFAMPVEGISNCTCLLPCISQKASWGGHTPSGSWYRRRH